MPRIEFSEVMRCDCVGDGDGLRCCSAPVRIFGRRCWPPAWACRGPAIQTVASMRADQPVRTVSGARTHGAATPSAQAVPAHAPAVLRHTARRTPA